MEKLRAGIHAYHNHEFYRKHRLLGPDDSQVPSWSRDKETNIETDPSTKMEQRHLANDESHSETGLLRTEGHADPAVLTARRQNETAKKAEGQNETAVLKASYESQNVIQ